MRLSIWHIRWGGSLDEAIPIFIVILIYVRGNDTILFKWCLLHLYESTVYQNYNHNIESVTTDAILKPSMVEPAWAILRHWLTEAGHPGLLGKQAPWPGPTVSRHRPAGCQLHLSVICGLYVYCMTASPPAATTHSVCTKRMLHGAETVNAVLPTRSAKHVGRV